jgi:hypothetical protein
VNRFLVTGVSGAGKSTLARQLLAWGHHAISADGDAALCGWYDSQGLRVTRPAHPDAAWLSGHAWRWDPARLDEIIIEADLAGVATLWLCGQAANALELADRFDAVLLLEIDQGTMAGRMRRPERGNDFGRVGDSLDTAVAGFGSFIAAWRRVGALSVDATRDVVTVAEDVLLTGAMATLGRR